MPVAVGLLRQGSVLIALVIRGEVPVLEPVVRVAGRIRVELQRQALRWLPGAKDTEELPDPLNKLGAVAPCPGNRLVPRASSA